MTSSSGKSLEPVLNAGLFVLVALPFLADLAVPLGTAVWIGYLLPVALSVLGRRPIVPLILAAVATILVVVGFVYANPGVNPDIARFNRALGMGIAWIMAVTGYFFIRNRLAVGREEWLQAGQVGLARAMSGEQRPEQLGDGILRYLADYTGAVVGAFYVEEGGAFQRRATYGVPSDSGIPERFERSDGLLGQVARDGRTVALAGISGDYLVFGSALGRARPDHLIVAPASADGAVTGVLELGFLGAIPDSHKTLLDRASGPIAIAIRSAAYRMRLRELLEETRLQAEELQRQSEELRASNDELEEQTRSLQDSQSRLEEQQAELEQNNAQLEEQAHALAQQRDALAGAQGALHAQARELEEASRYKSEFVANMSHELRTPLNSLLILARLLADNRGGNLTAEQIKFARTIETSGQDLLALINDVLDISKIEAGRVDLTIAPVELAPLATKLRTDFERLAQQKGLKLTIDVAADAPAAIESDAQRLEQILRNFLSNAVKFTDRGEVALTIGRGPAGVTFTVRDSGIGIPPEQQQTIFEAFRQADGTINRKYGGTGLGLSISRELARLLGGEITVDSAPGRGSAFSITVPAVHPDADAAKAAPLPVPPAPRETAPARPRSLDDDRDTAGADVQTILVVEDDPAFARILFDLAHELSFRCLVAETAEEAVTLARQQLPHAVILDIGLPDHTGLWVLDQMKRDMRTRHIPVHVVSANDYTQAALAFGAVGTMLKPVRREVLSQTLERLRAQFVRPMRRVLIVEDNADQLESLRLLLAAPQVETVGVRTAADCFAALDGEGFDCMVLDLSLPDASGFEVLERMGGSGALGSPPVIVYTGRDLSHDEELRLRKLSTSIIIKGAQSPERLLDEVTLFLHQVVADLPERQRQLLAKSMSRDAALEGRRILVVEDDIRNVFALTSLFEPHGATVEIARNGREAIDMLDRAEKPVDLVLMDLMMPEMDGLTATRTIRERAEWRSLPIIALTAKASPSDHEQCLAAGANDYAPKPLDVDKLLSLVRVWMPR